MAKPDRKAALAKLRNRQQTEIKTGGKKSPGSKPYFNLSGYDVKLFKPKKKDDKHSAVKIQFDIIPYEIRSKNHYEAGIQAGDETMFLPGDLDYKMEFYVHKQIGVNKTDVICPKLTFSKSTTFPESEKRCPICEERDAMMADGQAWDDDGPKALKAVRRVLYNVMVINAEGDEEIQIMNEPFAFMEKLLLQEAEIAEESPVTYSDLFDGRSIKATATETFFGKSKYPYWEYSSITFVEREPFEEAILDETIPLDSILVVHTYEDLKNIMFANEEDEEVPANQVLEKEEKKESGRKLVRRSKVEPEPELEPEKEEKPARAARTRKPKAEKDENLCQSGLRFGYDCNEKDECADCEDSLFDQCSIKADELSKSGKVISDDDIPY